MRNFTFKGLFLAAMFMVLGSLAIQAADNDGLITKQIIVKLEKAGTLPDRIGSTKRNKITNLKIIGEINGTDWRVIREWQVVVTIMMVQMESLQFWICLKQKL